MKENIANKLTLGMQQLCTVANTIVAAGGNVSAIERDLLLQDLRNLYAIALELTPSSTTEPAIAEAASEHEAESTNPEQPTEAQNQEPEAQHSSKPLFAPEEAEEPEPATTEPVMEQIENNGNEQLFEAESLMVFEMEPEPEPAPEPETAELEPAPETASEPSPQPEPEEEPAPEPEKPASPKPPTAETQSTEFETQSPKQPSLFDYLGTPETGEQPTVRTIADTIGHGTHNLSEQLERRAMQNKVSDLRTIININDKFSFMSELFHNNMKAYNDFILRLNAIDSRDVALEHVQEIARQYGWDSTSAAVSAFYRIFDRKF